MMGHGRTIFIAAVLATALHVTSRQVEAAGDVSVSRYVDGAVLLSPLDRESVSRLVPTTQEVITEDEYDRLTGVRKRLGVTILGGLGLMGGGDAGRLRLQYSDTQTSSVSYGDLFELQGYGVGAEVTLIVSPCYSVQLGGAFLFHRGLTYRGNDFSDLYRFPVYLALKFSLPIALEFDRWLDFENPEYVTGLLPYARIKLMGTWWSPVEISGPALPNYETSRDYFVQGLYPEFFGGAGVEIRLGAIALFGEIGLSYQLFNPRLSKYFAKDPTSPDDILPGAPFEFSLQAGVTYYFGSGRIFYIHPDPD